LSIGNDPTAGSPKGMVLFCGPAGGGKTLAADALAEALSLPIVRVDLSRTVSKYVGETEKKPAAVFARAKESGTIQAHRSQELTRPLCESRDCASATTDRIARRLGDPGEQPTRTAGRRFRGRTLAQAVAPDRPLSSAEALTN